MLTDCLDSWECVASQTVFTLAATTCLGDPIIKLDFGASIFISYLPVMYRYRL